MPYNRERPYKIDYFSENLRTKNNQVYFEFQEPDWGADDGWLSGIGELWASGVSDLGDEFNLDTGDSKEKRIKKEYSIYFLCHGLIRRESKLQTIQQL